MADARTEVLARIREALADVDRTRPVPEPERGYRTASPPAERRDRAALFAERASEYRVGVRRAQAGEVATATAAALTEHDASRVAIPPDLPDEWRPAAVELIADEGLSPDELDRIDGALTGSALAIADTGTVVLDAGPGQGRRALSLVPDLHVCVVAVEGIFGSLPEALAELERRGSARRPLSLVSGPSATSDIELNRVEGVHGPRRLELVIAG